jgi:hypothetical protein
VAATREAARLTEAHRLAQARLGAQVVAQILALFPLLDPEDLDATVDRWLASTLPAIQSNRAASARLAANYVDQFKKLELGMAATAPVVLAETVPADRVVGSLLVTGPGTIRSNTGKGVLLAKAVDTARVRVAGVAMQHVLDGGRDTTRDIVDADRTALGWARATSGSPCPFCVMLAGRGPVYKGELTAGFDPHPHCSCSAEPVYRRDADWPAGGREHRATYEAAIKEARAAGELNRGTSNDSLNALRRYMAHH